MKDNFTIANTTVGHNNLTRSNFFFFSLFPLGVQEVYAYLPYSCSQ